MNCFIFLAAAADYDDDEKITFFCCLVNHPDTFVSLFSGIKFSND